ncbi:Zinc finger protein MAGPIE [Apostasia shenzhenica]|uniref:Protein EARLY HEADING DATE 2 n=1 Tax=Apostasia shenzhenica TaxID=1088818 RepID=A0A2I0ARL0_9ASPA|nr:Zinc finger protein MAGPIE [Apostasia shenzhenica]
MLMAMELENSSGIRVSTSASSEVSASGKPMPPPKKKRNLPGTPDPNAEVIALSPGALLATNRFVCEICNKGFQRDQNLQLHRRGHNLPWKLRQRAGAEVRKRVYVCPEASCVHHNPSRALGDLTGIKKHFGRKHGEKKWKCDKCSKNYAVQSDWKAHVKTCGAREYRCDCGTIFSRKDSFITHRTFCDVLAVERTMSAQGNASVPEPANPRVDEEQKASPPVNLPIQQAENAAGGLHHHPPPPPPPSTSVNSSGSSSFTTTSGGSSNISPTTTTTSTSFFASLFASSSAAASTSATPTASFSAFIVGTSNHRNPESTANAATPETRCHFTAPQPSPHISATALLQKAAELGARSSSASFFRGFGLSTSSSAIEAAAGGGGLQCLQPQDQPCEPSEPLFSAGLFLGPSSMFGPKPATLDLLGLRMGQASSTTANGLSACINGPPMGVKSGAFAPPAKAGSGGRPEG